MASKDLVFRLFGEDVNASASLRKLSRSAEESGRGITKAFGNAPRDVTLVAAAAAGASVKMAADFQTATTRLTTDAGEQTKNLGKVRDGLLDISAKTGLSAKDTAAGMYLVESAGFHGAAGLKVMQAAAEGAKIGGADVKTVGDALTTTLTDFGKKAGTPAQAMSKLIATVSVGKTTMEDLAGSLHNVLPGAESAGIGLNQVLGAMGTMTAEGISADQASQNLNHSILALSNPTQVQAKAMAAVGLSAFDVAKNLGKKGLTGTYDELTHAITTHMKGGVVVEALFNRSKQAAQSANAELKNLPPSIRGIGEAYLNGSITQKEWTNQIKAQTPLNANLLKQFGSTAAAAHGFSNAVTSGQGPFKTYNAQLSAMTGGQVGLGVALHLSGIHSGVFADNVKAISGATSEAGGHVKGWAETQQNFNQQLAEAGTAAESVGISFGTLLLPALTHIAIAFSSFFNGLRAGNGGAVALAVTIGVVVAAFVTLYAATKTYELVAGGAKVATFLLNGVKRDGVLVTKAQAAADLLGNGITNAKVIATKLLTGAYFEQIGAVGKRIGLWIAEKAQIVFATGAMIAQRTAMIIGTAVTWAATAATTAFGVAVDIATGPIGIIILVVAALVAGIILLITHWKEVCGFLQTVWAAVCKWFTDTLKLLALAWQLEWAVITNVIRTVLGAIGGFFVSWWHNQVLPVINFFVNGWKLATAAAGRVPGMIIGFFRGAGTWLLDAGRNVIQGLINGVMGMVGNIGAAVGNIASGVIGTFKNMLGIHSPSTVFHDLGTFVVQGLHNGLMGSLTQIQGASNRIADAVIGMFDKGKITRASEDGALSTLKSGTAKLIAEANTRAAIAKQITSTQKTLTKELAAQRKLQDSTLKDSTLSAGNVTSFASSGDMINGLGELVAKTNRFRGDLGKLAKMGIDPATFSQLVQAGVNGGGLTAADELLANPMDLKQIVALQRQLQTAASSLASFAGQQEYAPTIAATRSKLKGLQAKERVEDWREQKTAAGMINTIARETHVHIHLTGHYAGTKDELAKSVTTAIRDAVRRGQLPKNVLTAL